ncbi:hypothetical protein BDV98DRAFT_291422 [Pterulicium gracile]|uniref:Uncharacterized protein n=1 Tax=Pterulicium gracile TaxID=1884261 RepID=A0A5C3QWZ3_9AGAR|nr:hypothetical protein BDV98DRAFT_291422 [Pterula gracilis]
MGGAARWGRGGGREHVFGCEVKRRSAKLSDWVVSQVCSVWTNTRSRPSKPRLVTVLVIGAAWIVIYGVGALGGSDSKDCVDSTGAL